MDHIDPFLFAFSVPVVVLLLHLPITKPTATVFPFIVVENKVIEPTTITYTPFLIPTRFYLLSGRQTDRECDPRDCFRCGVR